MIGWFAPHEIRFTPQQCLFLISCLPVLRDGYYPPEGRETGYNGIKGKGHGFHAPFEIPALLAVEIDCRLASTSTDGLLLVAEVQAELPLDPPAKAALRYISGWKRKRMDYKFWKRQRKYLQNRSNLTNIQA